MHTKLIVASLITLALINNTFAQSAQHDYFVDHEVVGVGKSLTANYSFPTPAHFIECHQDVSGSQLATVEWKYKSISFKAQAGDMRRLVLATDNKNVLSTNLQLADSEGQLVFTNLDNFELYVTCSYNTSLDEK